MKDEWKAEEQTHLETEVEKMNRFNEAVLYDRYRREYDELKAQMKKVRALLRALDPAKP